MVYDSLFLRSTSSCLLFMCPIIMVIQSYKCIEIKYTKSMNYVLDQNVNVTKQARFATSTISMVENFCLLRSIINETQSIENRIAVIDHKVTCSVTGILVSFIRR